MALIHDWLVGEGGAEKVLESFFNMFSHPPIYTLFYDHGKMEKTFCSNGEIHCSFLQKIPLSLSFYRHLLPFFPWAVESFDLKEFDLIVSSSHAVAKGIKVEDHQLHICYCHTPMRYIWDLQEEYLSPFSSPVQKALRVVFHRLRKWDIKTSQRVDVFVANSMHVAKRIERAYQRKAVTIYPPVAVDDFYCSEQKEGYYITHGRLVPYKRVDLLVEAFRLMPDRKLVIIGTGPEEKKLRKRASQNVEFLGFVERSKLALYLSQAKAYLFAAEEDFGIGVVEAQASGLPVIALGKGGALETVIQGRTGIFFNEASIGSLIEAIKSFEKKEDTFNAASIKNHAEQFSVVHFQEKFELLVEASKKEFHESRHLSRGKRNSTLASF